MANRLAKETSPYLLQHGGNPVDWYPWGEEALSRAKSENKPILLSIGYSACHWCHVMEHESFENSAIARQMNENFVCIKVDREERPDLDMIYQNVAQAMTQSGGWPLTVFLTPELKPFFGGTYYPPEDRYGRPGFPRVLEALSRAFQQDHESVIENAKSLTEFIADVEALPDAGEKKLSPEILHRAAETILSRVDWQEGGLAGAPKFPNPMIFTFLWRFGTSTGDESAQEAVLTALTKMACGGIYDQIGGGFSRYSVDDTWSVPHFEKMLYDNGLLLKLYAEVLLSDSPLVIPSLRELYAKILRETVVYLEREMKSPQGAFYAAQDADSEGEEGKFFVWDPAQLRDEAGLSPIEAEASNDFFGVSANGNFEHGKTVLFLAKNAEELPWKHPLFTRARDKLFAARSKRIAPSRDNKILASWNGLAISGLIWASRALEKVGSSLEAKQARTLAEGAFDFVVAKMSQGSRLFSTFQGGSPKLNAYLDDYAFMAMAALDLSRLGSEPQQSQKYLNQAHAWTEVILAHFRDDSGAGYFYTSDDHEKLIHRPKTIHDQAIPAGIAYTIQVLLALAEIDSVGDSVAMEGEALGQLRKLNASIGKSPAGYGELLNAILLQTVGPLVVSGDLGAGAVTNGLHFFKSGAELMLCHRKTCMKFDDYGQLLQSVQEKEKLL